MSKELMAVFSYKSIEHTPAFGTFDGVNRPSYDQPGRALAIIKTLCDLRATSEIEIAQPRTFGMPIIYSVHDQAYVDYLRETSERVSKKPPLFVAEIVDSSTKATTVKEYPPFTFPSVFPHGSNPRSTNKEAVKGFFSFDTATPIMANTYDVALAAANTAITGADMLVTQTSNLIYSLCRPPGHHAEKSRMGSYCYLNNAALAADYLAKQSGGKVGIIDIDAHHGNGTQEIFYENPNIFYASVHGDPSSTPPYYTGYADEKGNRSGFGFNFNLPLPKGSNDHEFIEAVDKLVFQIRQFGPQYIIVSLGFDGYKTDPCKVFNLTTDAYSEAAKRIGKLGLPTLSVQEGGYSINDLGSNIAVYLKTLKNIHQQYENTDML